MIYIIGSLRNPRVLEVGNSLRAAGLEAWDDWFAGGEQADDAWRDYEQGRGRSYAEALYAPAAQNIFQFDKRHIDRASSAVMVAPAGRSGHLELGYVLGSGKPGYILLDTEPERWDVMYQFATGVFTSLEDLIAELQASSADR